MGDSGQAGLVAAAMTGSRVRYAAGPSPTTGESSGCAPALSGIRASARLIATRSGVIATRAVRMATEGTVEAIDGAVFELGHPDSICLHSDTPGAVELARVVRAALEGMGVEVIAASR